MTPFLNRHCIAIKYFRALEVNSDFVTDGLWRQAVRTGEVLLSVVILEVSYRCGAGRVLVGLVC